MRASAPTRWAVSTRRLRRIRPTDSTERWSNALLREWACPHDRTLPSRVAVPYRGNHQRSSARVDHRHRRKPVHNDDASGERHRTDRSNREWSPTSMRARTSPKARDCDRQREQHGGPQNPVLAKESKPECAQASDNERRASAAQRGEHGTDDPGRITTRRLQRFASSRAATSVSILGPPPTAQPAPCVGDLRSTSTPFTSTVGDE